MDKLTLEERRRRRFSESFRKQQVSYIQEGSKTIGQVAHEFDVKTGKQTGKFVGVLSKN